MNENFNIVYNFKETPFEKLMQNHINDILLICSPYDKFMLDEDGRIDEQLFQEYVSLNLRYPPRFTHVSSEKEAFEKLLLQKYDLIITMLNSKSVLVFDLADKIKERYPTIPVVVLSPFIKAIYSQIKSFSSTKADYVFSWLGNARLLLAIVKLIEDKMNVENDVATANVQVVILVEDSIRYYSSYLPDIYRLLFKQARRIMEEGLNEHEQNLRMRGRPKILLATTLEDAIALYEKYKKNILGIISDIGYKINSKDEIEDQNAGLKLCNIIREDNPDVSILLQSAQIDLKNEAKKYNASFLYKDSETLLKELRDYIVKNYGFGDFIFHSPDGAAVVQASNLKELQEKLESVPPSYVENEIKENRFSKWLRARALFSLADIFEPVQVMDFHNSVDATMKHLIRIIKIYRENTGRGLIASFNNKRFDEFSFFSRVGDGSLGGKGRGLAFINAMIKHRELSFEFSGVNISIPRTVVISTSVFEDFMDQNNLYETAFSASSDNVILDNFLNAELPENAKESIRVFLKIINVPLSVRSSSLLEDSLYQPFAGVYATYMLPNNDSDLEIRIKELEQAIKSVYASTYFKNSKDYIAATKNVIDEEKMAVVVQEIAGKNTEGFFYPDIAGVAKSLNYFPLSGEGTDEGVAEVALGLGRSIVDGGTGIRFNPARPKKILQFASVDSTLKSSQKQFYALSLFGGRFSPSPDQAINIPLLDVNEAAKNPSFKYLASTYDMENHSIKDTVAAEGQKVITFAGILKYDFFPLAKILKKLLDVGKDLMHCPVEIEFAVNLSVSQQEEMPHNFSFLQIRPIVEGEEFSAIKLDNYSSSQLIVSSKKALGNGKYSNIYDFVYVKPDSFDPAKTTEIAKNLGKINKVLLKNNSYYILLVPGRLGSSDPWLGIPIHWAEICNSRVIIETGLKNFQVDPSQGTHFFHNITSLGIAYFTINPVYNDGAADFEYLKNLKAEYEDEFVRHIKFTSPVVSIVDGKNHAGIIIKPDASVSQANE